MDIGTISAIILGACGVLIIGMAGLIKTMVVTKLDALQRTIDGLGQDHHRLDLRVTKLEAEHQLHYCRYQNGNGEAD